MSPPPENDRLCTSWNAICLSDVFITQTLNAYARAVNDDLAAC